MPKANASGCVFFNNKQLLSEQSIYESLNSKTNQCNGLFGQISYDIKNYSNESQDSNIKLLLLRDWLKTSQQSKLTNRNWNRLCF